MSVFEDNERVVGEARAQHLRGLSTTEGSAPQGAQHHRGLSTTELHHTQEPAAHAGDEPRKQQTPQRTCMAMTSARSMTKTSMLLRKSLPAPACVQHASSAAELQPTRIICSYGPHRYHATYARGTEGNAVSDGLTQPPELEGLGSGGGKLMLQLLACACQFGPVGRLGSVACMGRELDSW